MSKRNNPPPPSDTMAALRDLEQALASPPLLRKDPVTGMLARTDFLQRLGNELNRAAEMRRPLALALFAIEGYAGLKKRNAEMLLRTLASRLWDSAQTEDLAGRLGDDLLALVLPGSGHFHALALAESVVSDVWRQYTALALEPFTLKASVAAPPLKGGAPAPDLLENARQALTQASGSPQAQIRERVRLYRKNDVPEERETMVLANEKQFLFFGGA